MNHNVCGTERIIRAAFGMIIALAGLYAMNWWGVIGLYPLLTASLGYCPLTQAFHFSSCPMGGSESTA